MVENNVPFLSGISENLLSELVPAPDLGWFWAHLTWRIVVFYEKKKVSIVLLLICYKSSRFFFLNKHKVYGSFSTGIPVQSIKLPAPIYCSVCQVQ